MKHSRHRYEEPPETAQQAGGFMRIFVGVSKLAIMAGVAYLTYIALAPLIAR